MNSSMWIEVRKFINRQKIGESFTRRTLIRHLSTVGYYCGDYEDGDVGTEADYYQMSYLNNLLYQMERVGFVCRKGIEVTVKRYIPEVYTTASLRWDYEHGIVRTGHFITRV